MAKRKPLTDADGEVRELSAADYAAAVPFAKLPASLRGKLGGARGRPKAAVTKERITIRLSRDVVAQFRASGEGWQTRVDAALKEWLRAHPGA